MNERGIDGYSYRLIDAQMLRIGRCREEDAVAVLKANGVEPDLPNATSVATTKSPAKSDSGTSATALEPGKEGEGSLLPPSLMKAASADKEERSGPDGPERGAGNSKQAHSEILDDGAKQESPTPKKKKGYRPPVVRLRKERKRFGINPLTWAKMGDLSDDEKSQLLAVGLDSLLGDLDPHALLSAVDEVRRIGVNFNLVLRSWLRAKEPADDAVETIALRATVVEVVEAIDRLLGRPGKGQS